MGMMVTTSLNLLGKGLYTAREAGFYARIKTQTMKRWVFGNRQGLPVVHAESSEELEGEPVVTFLDFVQALAIRAITTAPRGQGISLQKIREAVNTARDLYGVEYPFAKNHNTYLFGSRIVIELTEGEYRSLTGPRKDQRFFRPVVELYKKRLSFDKDGYASEYCAWESGDLKITMNPKVRFGEPLMPSGYTATTLWEGVAAEGSIEDAKRVYDVSTEEIELAYAYFDHLRGATAA